MLKLFNKDKVQTKESTLQKRVTAAELRMQKDLAELSLPKTMKIEFVNPDDLLNFTLTLSPDEGPYKNGHFRFIFAIKPSYPHDPPKVICMQTVFHPNIDLQGNICLNILREDWKPVLSMNSVVYGLQFLFLEPNPDDPLNKEAAELQRKDFQKFSQVVKQTMGGSNYNKQQYSDVSKQLE